MVTEITNGIFLLKFFSSTSPLDIPMIIMKWDSLLAIKLVSEPSLITYVFTTMLWPSSEYTLDV